MICRSISWRRSSAARSTRCAKPMLLGARLHAERGVSFGGMERNRSFYLTGERVRLEALDAATEALMLDPQTSGGLLVGVPAAHAPAWDAARAEHGVEATRI